MVSSLPATLGIRTFRFDETCRYRALQVGDEQWQSIANYEAKYQIPVHYMLYHPRSLPCEVEIPVRAPFVRRSGRIEVGTRILSAQVMRATVNQLPRNYAPAFSEITTDGVAPGAGLATFVIDDVLGCREGYVADDGMQNQGLQRVFNQRSGPIAAAIRIEINIPDGPGADDRLR